MITGPLVLGTPPFPWGVLVFFTLMAALLALAFLLTLEASEGGETK
jgi:hypothetical protein